MKRAPRHDQEDGQRENRPMTPRKCQNKCQKAISAILRFKSTFDNIGDPRVPHKLVGDIGEYYALQKLAKMGLQPEHRGGQGSYDIYLRKIHKRIEVRTSLLKNEGTYPDKTIRFWGWVVEKRNQKKKEEV